MQKNLVDGFDDIDKNLKDLGNLFNNGLRNVTRVTDEVSNEIARGNAEIAGKIEELAAALQGIQSQFKEVVPLQNSPSSSTSYTPSREQFAFGTALTGRYPYSSNY